MTVQPTPNSHNRHRAMVVGQSNATKASPVKLHSPANHTSWLHVSLFLEQLPKRQGGAA